MTGRKKCFNCETLHGMDWPVFCRDCWRMALITSALGATSSEMTHQLIQQLFAYVGAGP